MRSTDRFLIFAARSRLVDLAVAAFALLASGCLSDPFALLTDEQSERPAASRTAGESVEQLWPNVAQTFEIDVPAGQALELIAEPTDRAVLGVSRVESPDGTTLAAPPGAKAASPDRLLEILPEPSASEGMGLRLIGRASQGGTWRVSIVAARSAERAALERATRRVSVTENLLLLAYLLSGGPRSGERPPAFLRWSFPELEPLLRPVEIVVRFNLIDADSSSPIEDDPQGDQDAPADGSGGQAGDGADGGTGSGSDSGQASDDGGNDGAGSGSDGQSDPNEPAGGSDPNIPPPSVTPTEIVHTLIAQTGDAVPGQAGATFTYFSNPIIDSDGRVAFWAAYKGGRGTAGLYVWEGGTLRRVLDGDPNNKGVVPGRGANSYWGKFNITYDGGAPQMAWGSNGRLLFTAFFDGSPLPNGLYRWRAADGDMIRITDCEEFAKIFPDVGDTFLCEFFTPALSDEGIVAFANRYTYFTRSGRLVFRQRGLFTSNGLTVRALVAPEFARRGGVPGQGASTKFSGVEFLPTVHLSGDVLFQAQYADDDEGTSGRGVYRASGGQIVRVVDSSAGQTWPGLPAGARVGNDQAPYDSTAIGFGRVVAVDTKISGDGPPRDAVIVWNGTQWREVQAAGRTASELLAGVNARGDLLVLAGGRPYLYRAGSVIDLAAELPSELAGTEVTWEPFGGALNNHGRALLRYKRADGSAVGLAYWTDQELLVVADTAAGVPAAGFQQILALSRPTLENIDRAGVVKDRPEVDRPGRNGALNDREQMVLRLGALGADNRINTSDDVQALWFGQAR